MVRFLLTVLLLTITLNVSAGYKKDIMEPWMDASQAELVAAWGYPQTAEDLFKVNDNTTIYTYRSNRSSIGGQIKCTVSFTIRNEIVAGYKYEGGNCPRNRRKK